MSKVIGEAALDTVIDCQRRPDDEFLNALRQFLNKANNPIVDLAIYFPLIREILAIICRVASPCGQFTQSIIDKVNKVIEQRRLQHDEHGMHIGHSDILQLLLDAADDRLTENSSDCDSEPQAVSTNSGNPAFARQHNAHLPANRKLDDDEIVANAWVFLLGGFETTANALSYCSYLLATHPDVQEKLYHELSDNLEVNNCCFIQWCS